MALKKPTDGKVKGALSFLKKVEDSTASGKQGSSVLGKIWESRKNYPTFKVDSGSSIDGVLLTDLTPVCVYNICTGEFTGGVPGPKTEIIPSRRYTFSADGEPVDSGEPEFLEQFLNARPTPVYIALIFIPDDPEPTKRQTTKWSVRQVIFKSFGVLSQISAQLRAKDAAPNGTLWTIQRSAEPRSPRTGDTWVLKELVDVEADIYQDDDYAGAQELVSAFDVGVLYAPLSDADQMQLVPVHVKYADKFPKTAGANYNKALAAEILKKKTAEKDEEPSSKEPEKKKVQFKGLLSKPPQKQQKDATSFSLEDLPEIEDSEEE